ncbi:RluA family pseudouridine synthase [Vagococcus coleopterorum]|uniref:Pseudouridine synthase n=1 Tax=Vagococcus coleopterorum TaxID=2714946 RepID=A0A6G8AL51_9ENTE|nr:RluA family pseudouridine synthase [Vagococcus coleopterorum]QIL45717.1 RluA family pseudouridine synthase [Vagococcus coleopterorum]
MNYSFTIPAGTADMKLQTYLEQELQLSKKVRHQLRMDNGVSVNGDVSNFHVTVKADDQLAIDLPEADFPLPEIKLGDANLVDVLFEDDHLVIVDKPAGVKTHHNTENEANTMINHLAAYLADKNEAPYVVHRLDQETSGALIFAKNPLILPILDKLFEAKEIKRTYQTVVDGRLPKDTMTVNANIGRDRHNNRKRIVTAKGGQTAVTHFETVEKDAQFAYLNCQLETGRTHQIRVHLQSIDHPIVGDPLYHPQPNKAERMMLHSYAINFIHPFTKEEISLTTKANLWD